MRYHTRTSRRLLLVFCAAFFWSCSASPRVAAEQVQPPAPFVQGYAGQLSVQPGEDVTFHVSTSQPVFSLRIERLGTTNEQVYLKEDIPGNMHPIPDRASSEGCGWPVTFTLTVPADWKSGCYRARLATGDQARTATGSILFVVRAAVPGANTRVLLQLSTNTAIPGEHLKPRFSRV